MSLVVRDALGTRLGGASCFVPPLGERGDLREQAELLGVSELSPQRIGKAKRLGSLASAVARSPGRSLLIARERHLRLRARQQVAAVDAVVDISGYMYGRRGLGGFADFAALLAEEALRARKPYVALPQAWDPAPPDQQRSLKRLFNSSTRLYARDRVSQANLARVVGVSQDVIPLCPDIAFCFEAFDADATTSLPRKHDRLLVAVSPNVRVYERSSGIGENNTYVRTVSAIVRQLLAEDLDVLLIPHEYRYDKMRGSDDRLICSLIHLTLGQPERVYTFDEPLSASEIKAMIGRCELVIGSRFHALIGGLSQGIPALALGWSHKYDELMSDCGLRGCVVGLDDLSNVEKILQNVQQIWQNRNVLKVQLQGRLPTIRAHVDRMFDDVAALINGENG